MAVNGKKIKQWKELENSITKSNGKELLFSVLRGDFEKKIIIIPELTDITNLFGEKEKKYSIGITPLYVPFIGKVQENRPAQKAGLLKKDKIVAINNNPVGSSKEISDLIKKCNGKPLVFTIERENNIFNVEIIPELFKNESSKENDAKRYLIGIEFSYDFPMVKLGPVDAVIEGFKHTYFISKLTILSVGKMIKGAVSPKNLGGPIMIAQIAGDQVRVGLHKFLDFIALLSINLAILNLLPIPVLDGGHLFFFGIEAAKGSPVSLRVREVAQTIGIMLLLTLMVFVFYNDITRVLFG